MAELTFAQNCFLIHHKIPLSQVFDATGMKKKEYEEVMKELGMTIAIGVNPFLKSRSRIFHDSLYVQLQA